MTEHTIEIEGQTAAIATADELAVALDVLQGQHDRAVLAQLRPHLPVLVDSPAALKGLLKVLAPEDQLFLIEALGPALLRAVGSAAALRDILAMLPDAPVVKKLLTTLGDAGLRELIEAPEQLAEVLQWIYGQCDLEALDLLGPEFLRHVLEDGYELSLALNAQNGDGQLHLLELLGWEHVLGLMHDERDLGYLMRALPAELSRRLLDHLSGERLRELVRDARDLRAVTPYLEADELECLRGRLEAADAQ
jgi:hypothetical protein